MARQDGGLSMSRTISPGLIDASHWTYVATAMASRLHGATTGLGRASIPAGVLRAAQAFLHLAEEAASGTVPTDPVASAANYGIAARALRATARLTPTDRANVNERIRQYTMLVDALGAEDTASRPAAPDLEQLAEFFAQVA